MSNYSIARPLCQHFRRSGLDKTNSARWAHLIDKWVKCSGPDWAADRIKALQTFFHQRLEKPTEDIPIPSGFAAKTNRRGKRIFADGLLNNLLGCGQDLTKPNMSYKRHLAGLFLKCGTIIKADLSNDEILKKKLSSITQPHSGTIQTIPLSDVQSFAQEIFHVLSHGKIRRETVAELRRMPPPRHTSPEKWRDSVEQYFHNMSNLYDAESRRVFSSRLFATPLYGVLRSQTKSFSIYLDQDGQWKQKSLPHSDVRSLSPVLLLCHQDTPLAKPGIAYSLSSLRQLFESWTGDPSGVDILYQQRLGRFALPIASMDLPVGKIAVLNKDGWSKRRLIAIPSLDLQTQLDPLKQSLNFILSHFQASGVHDQDRARNDISRWLLHKEECYAFDQSSFTDRFPYKLQKQLLVELKAQNLGVTELDVALMDFAVNGKWLVPQLDLSVQYAVGQPMGLNPSFALASLSHLMIAKKAYSDTHDSPNKWQEHVRIVGDDIVIRGRETAAAYHKIMTDLGVAINRDKSMISHDVSNFCGRIITAEGQDPSLRVKNSDGTPNTVLSHLTTYGAKAYGFYRKTIQKIGDVFTSPSPIGLGFCPPTMSYSSFINSIDQDVKQALDYNKVILNQLGRKPSRTAYRKAVERQDAIKAYWSKIGFLGVTPQESIKPGADPVVSRQEDMQRYFGLSRDALTLLSKSRQSPFKADSLRKDEEFSKTFMALVDDAARFDFFNKWTAVSSLFEHGNKVYEGYRNHIHVYGYSQNSERHGLQQLCLSNIEDPQPDKESFGMVHAKMKQALVQDVLHSVPELQSVHPQQRIKVINFILADKGDFYVQHAVEILSGRTSERQRFFRNFTADTIAKADREIREASARSRLKRTAQSQQKEK